MNGFRPRRWGSAKNDPVDALADLRRGVHAAIKDRNEAWDSYCTLLKHMTIGDWTGERSLELEEARQAVVEAENRLYDMIL